MKGLRIRNPQLKLYDDLSSLPLYVWHLILLLTNYTFQVLLVTVLSPEKKRDSVSVCVYIC